MTTIVADTSAILAMYFREPTGAWVADELDAAGRVLMSTVNLAECLIRFRDVKAATADDLEARLLAARIEFVLPTVEHASIVARARVAYPLNFGDCFAYTLARTANASLLTLDSDFRATGIQLVLPPGE